MRDSLHDHNNAAWACPSTPQALLAAALATPNHHVAVFADWVTAKASRPPEEITFVQAGLYYHTYHRDALRVSQIVPLPPTHPRRITGWDPAQHRDPLSVLEFCEFHTELAALALALTAAGQTIAFIDHKGSATVFRTPEDVHAHVAADRRRQRQRAIDHDLTTQGAAQLSFLDYQPERSLK